MWDSDQSVPLGDNDGTILLADVKGKGVERIVTDRSWDICFGGGIVRNSVALLGGVAGAGKSTLSLQLADIIAGKENREVVYIAAEENGDQIKDRALRLDLIHMNKIRLIPMGMTPDFPSVFAKYKPAAVFFDSLAGFSENPANSVDICKTLKHIAVQINAPFLVIDHVTKTDDFAGLEALKHTVDTTMTLYCTGVGEIREMTVLKNRFGPANISIHLMMTEKGLVEIDTESESDDD